MKPNSQPELSLLLEATWEGARGDASQPEPASKPFWGCPAPHLLAMRFVKQDSAPSQPHCVTLYSSTQAVAIEGKNLEACWQLLALPSQADSDSIPLGVGTEVQFLPYKGSLEKPAAGGAAKSE
jgi:hypothetical protein